jgi:hypothetical protein
MGADMPSQRAGGNAAVIDGSFIYLGGSDVARNSTGNIYLYNPQNDFWSEIDNLPAIRHRPVVEVLNNNLYVITGAPNDYANEGVTTNYLLSSTHLSDPYQKESYSTVSWTATTPSGTSAELLYSLDSGKTYSSLGYTAGTYHLPPNSAYSLKYKAVLSTDNTSITPSLDSVTVSYAQASDNLYASNMGTFVSAVIDLKQPQSGGLFEKEDNTPTGTSIIYFFRSGTTVTPDETWSDWSVITDTLPFFSRYGQVKAVLSTTDLSLTPTLSSMTLLTSNSSGRRSAPTSLSPVFESPPSPFRVIINNGSAVTSDRSVSLSFVVGNPVKNLLISITPDFTDASEEDYVDVKQFDLCSRQAGTVTDFLCPDSIYTVYVRFLLNDGSIQTAQSSIALRTAATLVPPSQSLPSGQQQEGNRSSSSSIPPSILAEDFTRHLWYRVYDDDVKRLQMFLNQDSETRLSEKGAGSPGQETMYFGKKTRNAVIRFQEKYFDEVLKPWNFKRGTGYVGDSTLAKINSLIRALRGD